MKWEDSLTSTGTPCIRLHMPDGSTYLIPGDLAGCGPGVVERIWSSLAKHLETA